MQSINNILVVLSDAQDAPYVLEKVQVLATASNAKVHVVRVIYEGVAELSTSAIEDSARLKTFILEAAESVLEEMLDPWRGMLNRTDPAPVRAPAPRVRNRVAGNALLILSAGGDPRLSKADAKRDALDVAFPAPRDAGFWHPRLEDDVILLSEPVPTQPSN